MYLYMLLSLHSCFRFCFRHVSTYSSIIQEHIHAYSKLSVSFSCSKPWHIPIPKRIQTQLYIQITILNIFTKAHFSTFDANMNPPLIYRCYLTSTVTLHIFTVIFQNYSGIFKTYSAIFSPAKTYLVLAYLEHSASVILRHILNATHNI